MRLKPAALAFALLCTAAPQAYAQAVPAPAEAPAQSFVTRHVGTFNGQKVKYVATVGETVLRTSTAAAVALGALGVLTPRWD